MLNSVVVRYSDLKGLRPTQSEFDELISQFKLAPTFQFLSMLNGFLSIYPSSTDEDTYTYVHNFLCANLLDQELSDLVEQKLQGESAVSRPTISRWAFLFLLKKLLLRREDGEVDPGDENNKSGRLELGKSCLFAHDLFISKEQEDQLEMESKNESVLDLLMCQLIPVFELMNPPSIRQGLIRTQSYLRISKSLFPTRFNGDDLSTHFESLTGISLSTYLQMVVGIYLWYVSKEPEELINNPINFNLKEDVVFSEIGYSQTEIEAFFGLTLAKISNLMGITKKSEVEEWYQQFDFRAFRQYPLLSVTHNVFTIIDFGFLAEKVSSGLYHTILNTLNGSDRDKFFPLWGKVFEEYVNEILREIYPRVQL